MAHSEAVDKWLRDQPTWWLLACARAEGGRARLCMEGYGSAATAVYFAQEAARYANVLLERQQLDPLVHFHHPAGGPNCTAGERDTATDIPAEVTCRICAEALTAQGKRRTYERGR